MSFSFSPVPVLAQLLSDGSLLSFVSDNIFLRDCNTCPLLDDSTASTFPFRLSSIFAAVAANCGLLLMVSPAASASDAHN